MVEYTSVYEFFVDYWWYSCAFHLVMYGPMWLTKAGRWSEIWAGDRA